jgi:prophage regulatory protein
MHTILRLPDVKRSTGLSRSTIYLRITQGTFPKPVSLGGRAVGWLEAEVQQWLQRRIEASRIESSGVGATLGATRNSWTEKVSELMSTYIDSLVVRWPFDLQKCAFPGAITGETINAWCVAPSSLSASFSTGFGRWKGTTMELPEGRRDSSARPCRHD